MTIRLGRPVVGLLVLLAAGTAAVTAAAVELRPYRALYDFSFKVGPRDGSWGITLRGERALEWADTCKGWTVSENYRVNLPNPSGGSLAEIVLSFSIYETKSGDRYRFNYMHSIKEGNRVEEEEYVGHAEPGRAVFTVPDGESMPLPEGTVFPAKQWFLLVEAATAGESRLTWTVFDGTGPDGLNEVTAFIGTEIPAGTPLTAHGDESAALRELAELRSWPVWVTESRFESNAPEPDSEGTFRLFENGVAASLIFHVDEVTMNMELTEIEFFPPPAC